ncbi:hypothetical protein FB451DRAFT_1196277 [Mycena latifolia]|nr:hypothetical protein FB451DRAFT_1196277 [Mycena latifolia]
MYVFLNRCALLHGTATRVPFVVGCPAPINRSRLTTCTMNTTESTFLELNMGVRTVGAGCKVTPNTCIAARGSACAPRHRQLLGGTERGRIIQQCRENSLLMGMLAVRKAGGPVCKVHCSDRRWIRVSRRVAALIALSNGVTMVSAHPSPNQPPAAPFAISMRRRTILACSNCRKRKNRYRGRDQKNPVWDVVQELPIARPILNRFA